MSQEMELSQIESDMIKFLRENKWEILFVEESAITLKQDDGTYLSEVAIGGFGWVSRRAEYFGKIQTKATIFSNQIEVYAGLIKDRTKQ